MITKKIVAEAVCTIIEDVTFNDIMKPAKEEGAKEDSLRFARQLCMALARKYKLGSQKDVAGFYGGRDHATCSHSEKVINREIEIYPEKALLYHRIEVVILEMSIKNLRLQFQQQMDLELARFLRRAQEISSRLLHDIELKEAELNNIVRQD